MTPHDKVVQGIKDLLNVIDQLETPENKRRLVTWTANVWNHGIRMLAAYTAVQPDVKEKAKAAIVAQLDALNNITEGSK